MAHDSPIPDAIPFRTLGPLSGAFKASVAALIVVGVAAALTALGEPERLWQGLLFNWLFWSSLAIGMTMFAVALHITSADWAWSVRRFALGGAAFLPISFVLFLVVLFGGSEVYFHHWLHVEGDPVIDAKRAWLNFPGLAVRDIVVLLVLYGLALAFLYFSVRPDVYGARNAEKRALYERLTADWRGVEEEARRSKRVLDYLAPVLGILFAVLWSIIAVDMAMSLSPHWFSTMFPVAFFWAAFQGGTAATAIAMAVLRPRMRLEPFITGRQFHDLGKLVFAFSVFWMYLNWSQYIVIWYGLLPWEQDFFIRRFSDPYGGLSAAVVILVFVLPFLGLLARPPKQVPAILAFFSGGILLGHWIERFLITVPSIWEGEGLPLGLPEIGIGIAFMGLFLAAYTWYLRSVPILPSPATLAAQDKAFVAVPATASGAR